MVILFTCAAILSFDLNAQCFEGLVVKSHELLKVITEEFAQVVALLDAPLVKRLRLTRVRIEAKVFSPIGEAVIEPLGWWLFWPSLLMALGSAIGYIRPRSRLHRC